MDRNMTADMRRAHLANKDRLGSVVLGRINKPAPAFVPMALVSISRTLNTRGDTIKGTEKIRAMADDTTCGWTFVLAKQHHPQADRFGQPWEVLLWVQAVDLHGEWVSLA
jgi:hypothetical protein